MLVYRVQCKKYKGGVYRYLGNEHAAIVRLKRQLCVNHNDTDHPGIWMDFDNWDSKYICGFDNLDKLKVWFDGFIETFNQLSDKIELAVYRAKDIVESKSRKQVGFLRKTARKVKTISFTSLLNNC